MKFAIFTVVVCALVYHAQSSAIPIALGGAGPLLAVSGPIGAVAVPTGSVAIQASVLQGLAPSVAVQVPNAISAVAVAPAATVAIAPAAAVAVPAPIAVAAEGTYVAKTRGAVHVAPLPGHLQSAASVNLQPAPGTL